MAFVCCPGERRKSLLCKLKDLVCQIDDKGGCPCGPCGPCPPCVGPVIEIYDPLPKPCLPICSPCGPCGPCGPCCPPACCPPCPQPTPCPVIMPSCPPAACVTGCLPICKPCPPPCVPVQCPGPKEPQPCVPCNPPQMMVCYRMPCCGKNLGNCKSREILSSILIVGCDCEKRNGLQDDCPRFVCKGAPCCLTKPTASCCPSQYSGGKHLGKRHRKKDTEKYQCYPAYVRLPPCGPAPCCPPCGPCPAPYVPLIPAPPCPPPICPGPPPMVPVGTVMPSMPCCPMPCAPPCCPCPC